MAKIRNVRPGYHLYFTDFVLNNDKNDIPPDQHESFEALISLEEFEVILSSVVMPGMQVEAVDLKSAIDELFVEEEVEKKEESLAREHEHKKMLTRDQFVSVITRLRSNPDASDADAKKNDKDNEDDTISPPLLVSLKTKWESFKHEVARYRRGFRLLLKQGSCDLDWPSVFSYECSFH